MSIGKCDHAHVQVVSTHGFRGSVAGLHADQNQAAHGNICEIEECRDCGARRSRNVNGLHQEIGAWGPSRAQRIVDAKARLASLPVPMPLYSGELSATCDRDGTIVIRGPHADELAVLRMLPAEWIEAARRRREASRGVECEVQS